MQKYNKRIKAKKTLYKGIWFKSNLEARVAEAFDKLQVEWSYEHMCFKDFRFHGGQYTPDFYLAKQDLYVEVAGVWDERHVDNARVLTTDYGLELMGVDGDGDIFNISFDDESHRNNKMTSIICEGKDCIEIAFAKCEKMPIECPICGTKQSGDLIEQNIFEFADEIYGMSLDWYECMKSNGEDVKHPYRHLGWETRHV